MKGEAREKQTPGGGRIIVNGKRIVKQKEKLAEEKIVKEEKVLRREIVTRAAERFENARLL
jgi:hypothetical protein